MAAANARPTPWHPGDKIQPSGDAWDWVPSTATTTFGAHQNPTGDLDHGSATMFVFAQPKASEYTSCFVRVAPQVKSLLNGKTDMLCDMMQGA